MDECPFCGQAIDDVLSRFGGTCPRCFGEIPGEEAATDPGEAPDSADAPARPRPSPALAVGFGAVVGTSLVILAVLGARLGESVGETEVMDFDDWPMPEIVAVVEEADPVVVPVPQPRRAPRRPDAYARRPETLAPPSDLTAALRSNHRSVAGDTALRRRASGQATARSITAPPAGRTGLAASGTGSVEISVAAGGVRRDDSAILDDPVAIRTMIGERLRRGIAELRGCYDRRLKQRPDLAGRWRLTFTVSPEGRATDASLAGLDGNDEALEGCLREHVVRRWAFAPVAEPTEVSKTLSFHVGP